MNANDLTISEALDLQADVEGYPDSASDLRRQLAYLNDRLLVGSSLRVQWVYAQGRPCNSYRFHVVQDFEPAQPSGVLATGVASFLTFRELQQLVAGIEFGLGEKR